MLFSRKKEPCYTDATCIPEVAKQMKICEKLLAECGCLSPELIPLALQESAKQAFNLSGGDVDIDVFPADLESCVKYVITYARNDKPGHCVPIKAALEHGTLW